MGASKMDRTDVIDLVDATTNKVVLALEKIIMAMTNLRDTDGLQALQTVNNELFRRAAETLEQGGVYQVDTSTKDLH